jgi:hypothetical protein
MNWARSRWEVYIAKNGSESAYRGLGAGSGKGGKDASRKGRKKKKRPVVRTRVSAEAVTPLSHSPMPSDARCRAVLAEFRALPLAERVQRGRSFKARVERLVGAEDVEQVWQTYFQSHLHAASRYGHPVDVAKLPSLVTRVGKSRKNSEKIEQNSPRSLMWSSRRRKKTKRKNSKKNDQDRGDA